MPLKRLAVHSQRRQAFLLKERNLRMTRQRQVILEELRATDQHPSADDLYGRVKRKLPRISLGTVYQSPIKVQLTGKYRVDYSDEFQRMIDWFGSSPTLLMISGMLNLPVNSVPYQSGTVTSEYEFPQRLQFGLKLKPFKRLSLMADLHWAN